MSVTPVDKAAFWNLPLNELLASVRANTEGITTPEASDRLVLFGLNVVTDVRHSPLWLQFILRFRNPLVVLLLIAGVLSALTGDAISFSIIVAIVVLSVTLDFAQEERAEKAVDALRESVALKATVLRDGIEVVLPVRDIVPGDVVLLSPGNLLPADGRLLSVKDLYVNQSLLTGESFPAEKTAHDLPTATSILSEATNAVFMGTSIISGTATMVVTSTGKHTQLGHLAGSLAQRPPLTSFELGIQAFGMMIMYFVIGIVLFVLLVNLNFHRPFLVSFLFALALAVGLTPELLPMIMTITLARGALRMAKERVIVKHLPAMHNLGAMDVLCTDKTGTLTEAKIHLVAALNTSWQESRRVFELAYLNSAFESGIKTPLDKAILEHGKVDIEAWRKIDEVPFDFERRRVSVLAARGNQRFLIVKGSPEDILKCSTHYETSDRAIMPLSADALEKFKHKFDTLSDEGQRVLGVAVREVDAANTSAMVPDEMELIFTGFLSFLDPPKASAGDALHQLSKAGIVIKIISGDNERVTAHVCRMLGLTSGEILTGDVISTLNDEALLARVDKTLAFCRVTPQQKSHIIATLKRRGHTVGFLGDGINDAPALHVADVGISVDSAADVAKQAADIILLEQDLSMIHAAVREGRRTVVNVSKYILMAVSANFGNMFSMAGGTLLLPFLPMLPIQILLGNLLYDLAQTGLPFDRVDSKAVAKPLHWDIRFIRRFMLIIGPIASLFDFVTFYLLLRWFGPDEIYFHSGWFVESLAPQMLAIFSIRTRGWLFTSWPHPAVSALAIGMSALIIILPFTPVGAWFGLAPLPPLFFLFIVVVTISYFALLEAVKYLFYRRFG